MNGLAMVFDSNPSTEGFEVPQETQNFAKM
jgi:hypothetical protein